MTDKKSVPHLQESRIVSSITSNATDLVIRHIFDRTQR
jgi:hypothetical protein